jgi:transposase
MRCYSRNLETVLRRPIEPGQYLSIRYTERLKRAGLEPSVGSVGDSYDNALAESIIGLYKTEVIRRRGPWRDLEAVEFATLNWVHWFNHWASARTDWIHAAGGEGGCILSSTGGVSRSGMTQPQRSPEKPGRFNAFFVEKVRDIVGLYLNPPEHALVLCVDEKSQVQALERTQPLLPMGLGYVEGVTHGYVRHGTNTLFAALKHRQRHVISQCKARHRHQEFLSFLRHIEANVPAELEVHLICDNYATHKHPRVRSWLARRPRFPCALHPRLGESRYSYPAAPARAAPRASEKSARESDARLQCSCRPR